MGSCFQIETLYLACEWQLWDAERFRKLVKNEEDAQVWVSGEMCMATTALNQCKTANRSNRMGQPGQYVLAL